MVWTLCKTINRLLYREDVIYLMNNNFRKYTDNLAVTLENKNKAYGDSFTKSVDKYGLSRVIILSAFEIAERGLYGIRA